MPEVVKDLSFCMLLIFYVCSTVDGFSITVSKFFFSNDLYDIMKRTFMWSNYEYRVSLDAVMKHKADCSIRITPNWNK